MGYSICWQHFRKGLCCHYAYTYIHTYVHMQWRVHVCVCLVKQMTTAKSIVVQLVSFTSCQLVAIVMHATVVVVVIVTAVILQFYCCCWLMAAVAVIPLPSLAFALHCLRHSAPRVLLQLYVAHNYALIYANFQRIAGNRRFASSTICCICINFCLST